MIRKESEKLFEENTDLTEEQMCLHNELWKTICEGIVSEESNVAGVQESSV